MTAPGEIERAWLALPAALRAHPGVKALHRAALAQQPAASVQQTGFDVVLSPESEARFSKWVGVADMTPWQRSVARLALLLNTTQRGLIDYDAAQHFARELMARTVQPASPGWVLVPVEPTQAMCQEGQWKAREWPKFPLRIVPIWKAMLAAAPTPQQEPKP